MRAYLMLLPIAALSACSSSGVATLGPNTFKVTNTAITSFGGAASAKGGAYKVANEHCAGLGKKAVVITDTSAATIASGSAEVTFRCE